MKFRLIEKVDPLDHKGLISDELLCQLIADLKSIKAFQPKKEYQFASDGYGVDIFWDTDYTYPIAQVTKYGKMIFQKNGSKDKNHWIDIIHEVIDCIEQDGRLQDE